MWFKCSALVACVHTTKKRSQKLIYIYIKGKKKKHKNKKTNIVTTNSL